MDQMRAFWNRLVRWSAPLFPDQVIFARKITVGAQLALLVGFAVLFAAGAGLYHANGFLGFDWVNVFSKGLLPPFYPPWDAYVIHWLTWPALIGLTLAATCLAILKRSRHPLSLALALLTLPLFWTLFLGQLEGLVVLGLLGLPWLAPLALLKPQVSLFAFGARRSYVLGLFIFLAVSLLIWGLWPARMLSANTYYAEGRYVQDISLGWWGAVVALPLLWLSRGDMDMLMLAGTFMTPHLIPYNLLPVVPAIARLRPGAAALVTLFSWLPLTANWLGPGGWWLGWVFVGFLWLSLAADRYPGWWIAARSVLAKKTSAQYADH